MSSKGQIVIPKEVRARRKLGRDTDLVLLESGDALVLHKKADVEWILNDEFAPLLRATEDGLRDLWEDDFWDGVGGETRLARPCRRRAGPDRGLEASSDPELPAIWPKSIQLAPRTSTTAGVQAALYM